MESKLAPVSLPPIMRAVIVLCILAAACTTEAPVGSTTPSASPAATSGVTGPPSSVATPIAVPSSSLPPTPTVAPTSTPVITPAPTAVSGDVVIERFLTDFAAEQPPFHLVSTVAAEGTAGGEGGSISVSIEGDVSGEDMAGTLELSVPGLTVEVDVIVVDGRGYGRVGEGDWEETTDFEQTQPMNPFSLLAAEDLTYEGPVSRDGRRLHALRTLKWIGDDLRNLPFRKAKLGDTVFDVYVGDDGIPVEATLVFDISGRYQRQRVSLAYDVSYLFSDVGKAVTIEAPIR